MPPRRTARDERGATKRPVKRRAADEEEEFFDDQEPADEEPEDQEPEDRESELEPEEDTTDRGGARGRGDGQRPGRVTAGDAAQNGVRSLVELIGKKPEGVTAVEPTEDGWLVGVEVVEDQRVPSSADILAVYEAELDPDGGLISYRRTARYARGKGDMSGSSLNDQ